MKVLIAEDEPSTQLLLRRFVEKLGHRCVVAEDGSRAWVLYRETEPDVIISDWTAFHSRPVQTTGSGGTIVSAERSVELNVVIPTAESCVECSV